MTHSELQRQTWGTPLKIRRETVGWFWLAQLSYGLRTLGYINLMHHEKVVCNLEGQLVAHP